MTLTEYCPMKDRRSREDNAECLLETSYFFEENVDRQSSIKKLNFYTFTCKNKNSTF